MFTLPPPTHTYVQPGVPEIDLMRYPAVSKSRLARIVVHVRTLGFIWQPILIRILEAEENYGSKLDQKMIGRYLDDLSTWGHVKTMEIDIGL